MIKNVLRKMILTELKEKNMKKNSIISLVALTMLTLVGSTAYATDTFTVNNSGQEGAKGAALTNAYVPQFLSGGSAGCTATAGDSTSTNNCDAFGAIAVSAWIDNTFMTDGSQVVPMPDFNNVEDFSFVNAVFGVGSGLPTAWLAALQANPVDPLTAPAIDVRTQWVDQIAIGYVQSSGFAQNFRSQISFGNSWNEAGDGGINRDSTCAGNAAECSALIDQRLEQGDSSQTNGIGLAENTKQAFQQSFGLVSTVNTTSDPEFNGDADAIAIGQNVEQTGEGFFYSCLNCNSSLNEHAFTPPVKLTYQTWPTRPRIAQINHAGAATDTTWTP
jgi:hypothetical protein